MVVPINVVREFCLLIGIVTKEITTKILHKFCRLRTQRYLFTIKKWDLLEIFMCVVDGSYILL